MKNIVENTDGSELKEDKPIEDTPKKSILVTASKASRPADETEVAAQISVSHDGGWGWLVVLASFWSIFVLDGVVFTFGSMYKDITKDLKVSVSAVALINSIAVAVYFLGAPLASAFINRFGFRSCVMTGSVVCSFALVATYFATSYATVCLFYGVLAGFGYCLINMASILVVGFYFERQRALALALTASGSSFGISAMFPLNSYIVRLAGWRALTLLHSGLFALIYFLGMTYRPLLSLTVTKCIKDPSDVAVYMPSLAFFKEVSNTKSLTTTATERMFTSISNATFPTASELLESSSRIAPQTQAGPSTLPFSTSRMTIKAWNPRGALSQRQLKRIQSNLKASEREKRFTEVPISIQRKNSDESTRKLFEIKNDDEYDLNNERGSILLTPKFQAVVDEDEERRERSCWYRIFHWEPHLRQARPLYRDDAFYEGRVRHLPQYRRGSGPGTTGLEYQLAVTRAVALTDLRDHDRLFNTAMRRVLATMMDCKLLVKKSFQCLCLWAFLMYTGYLVPYIFLKERNLAHGMDPKHCSIFVSAIGLSNAIGRLILGSLAWRLDALKLFTISVITAGIGTMLSNVCYDLYFQYSYCCVYGFSVASLSCLRSLVVVDLYGLDKLTNATGMMLMFQGMGSLVGSPIVSILKTKFGYEFTFYVAGGFMTLSGICLIPLKSLTCKERICKFDV